MLKHLFHTGIALSTVERWQIEVLCIFDSVGRMAISAITLRGVLLDGAEKSAEVVRDLAVVVEMASLLEIPPYTARAAQHCGTIRSAV